MSPGLHPECDDSELLAEEGHTVYQQLIGILQWLVTIGQADLQYLTMSLSRFSAAPRKTQLEYAIRVFSYLKEFPDKEIRIDPRDIPFLSSFGEPDDTMIDSYPGAHEELDKGMPEALGPELQTSVWFDSDHAHDLETRRSCTGLVIAVGRTPVLWSSKRQTSVMSSSYSAEFMAGRSACEEAIALRYMLRCLGVKLKGRTYLCGDNLGMLQSSTIVASVCKKKHVSVSWHIMRECVAVGITNPVKVDTSVNIADVLTKSLPSRGLHYHLGTFFGQWDYGKLVDVKV